MSGRMVHADEVLCWPAEAQDAVAVWLAEHDIERRAVYAVDVLSDHLVTVYRFELPVSLHPVTREPQRRDPLTVQCRRPFPIPADVAA